MRKRPLPLLLLLAVTTATAASSVAGPRVESAADPAALTAFLESLAPAPAGPIPFVEKRMSALLTAPLELRGELTLGRDGTIDKRVVTPIAERVVISAGSLQIERDGKTRTMQLGRDGRWQAFHAGMTGLMRHDVQALTRVFVVTLEQSSTSWTIRLVPRESAGKKPATSITATGRGALLLAMRMDQGADEWQEMQFPEHGT